MSMQVLSFLKRVCFLFFIFGWCGHLSAQENWHLEGTYYVGSIVPHNAQITHLITEKPTGFLVSVNKALPGDAYWQTHFNYPDLGFSLHYQNNHNDVLGDLWGVFVHYNFYFFQRKMQLRVAQGFAYATHPYDADTNFRNMAYGSHVMPSTYFKLDYQERNLWKNWGVHAGLFFIHHSNATIKSPNTSTNTVALSAGLLYDLDATNHHRFAPRMPVYDTQWRFNAAFRTGVNESHIVGMGQKPFYHFSAFASKRLGYTGTVQAGSELFLSYTIKEMIPFLAESFPEFHQDATADWKRIGVFVGYEMHLNKLSAEGQFGAYVYDHYKENGSFYQRLGLRYYVSEHYFASMSLKTHLGKAEAYELGIGLKL